MNVLRQDLQKLVSLAEAAPRPADPWRPGFHLAPPTGWLNDPNGLSFFRGEYHVFYQYHPFDPACGLKFWGHYKSRNLLEWEQCPVMLCPDQTFDLHGVYSGSALCEDDGLYLYYTGNVKYEGDYDYIQTGREANTVLAFSPDGVHLAWKRLLMRNTDYPAGLTLHVRDPKVWKQGEKYYMVQGARTETDEGVVLVFESADKFQWRHINTIRTPEPFGYMWECPDLFELDGQWFLLVSPQGPREEKPGMENVYACGYFPLSGDFRSACELGPFVPLDYGFDFYAPQTFTDGKRRLLIGWMGMPDAEYDNPTADRGWQHCLTVPREVLCRNGRLIMKPVRELESLRETAREVQFSGRLTTEVPETAEIGITCGDGLSLELSGLVLEASDGLLTLTVREGGHGREVRHAPVKELRNLRILADTSAAEIFVNDGETVLTTRWYPENSERILTLTGRGSAEIRELGKMPVTKYE